jgi:NTP pyrophosphatase (non-canonical NTP hydrolase)
MTPVPPTPERPPDPDSLRDLTAAMHAFVSAKGWYAEASRRPQTPRNLAISLVLEAGEVLEHFQWRAEAEDKSALAAELADVLLYLMQIASIEDIDLGAAVLAKLQVNHDRVWDADADDAAGSG